MAARATLGDAKVTVTDFRDRLDSGEFLLLDGAMGTELERRGVPMHASAWSAAALATHPDVVRGVHEDYVRLGAEVHIVNSFATARHVLEAAGLGGRVEELNRRAVALCREAVERARNGRRPWIAGSLSTYAAGSDRGKLPPLERLRANFDEQAGILADAGVDLFVLEMLFDVEVSGQALEAAAATGLPVSIGFTCDPAADGETVLTHMGRGEPRRQRTLDAVLPAVIAAIPANVSAVVTVMHSDFDVTDAALDVVERHWHGPTAVYPNSGAFVTPNWQFDTVCSPDEFAAAAERWIARGVQIVGGCCGIGPDHIRALRDRLPGD